MKLTFALRTASTVWRRPRFIHSTARNYARNASVPRGQGQAASTSSNTLERSAAVVEKEKVLYERDPDWYYRLIWALIAMEIGIAGNFTEMIFDHWSRPSTSGEKDEKGKPIYELRPLWQRWTAATFCSAAGVAFAFGLYRLQFRVVRLITLNPNTERLTVRTVGHFKGKGFSLDKKNSTLEPGRDDTELFLRSLNPTRVQIVDLRGAKINGQSASLYENRRRFQELWFGVRLGGRWLTGASSGHAP